MSRGLHPSRQTRLAPAINRTRAYYDLTVSAPKTISLAALLEPDHPTAFQVMKAHVNAVHAVGRAAGEMIRPQSPRSAPMAKWIGVVFCHTHTREGDPHLHSHIVIPNLMLNEREQWRALQVSIVGHGRHRLGLIYGHELARNLRRIGLGAEVEMRSNGIPELRSLKALSPAFSRSRRAVLSAVEELEAAGSEVKEKRPSKPSGVLPGLHDSAKLNRRRRLADMMRKVKPKGADDPTKLRDEALQWRRAVSGENTHLLLRVLERQGSGGSYAVRVFDRMEPMSARQVIQSAQDLIPPGAARISAADLMRLAVQFSAGNHEWEDLVAACRGSMDGRKRLWQRIREDVDSGISMNSQTRRTSVQQAVGSSTGEPVAAPTPGR